MDILAQLKTATRPQHEQTETLLNSHKLMAGTLTPAEYGQLLQIHYRFHQALATALDKQALDGYDNQYGRKLAWLADDLKQLGMPLPTPDPALFGGWTASQLLGAIYVAEGSMLGGQVIAKALRRTPGLTHVDPQFFSGFGAETGPRWKAFGTYLSGQADGHSDEITAGARLAFGYFQQLAA